MPIFSDQSGAYYIIWITAATTNPLITAINVKSADGAFAGGIGGEQYWTTPIDIYGIMNSASNGLWTMDVTSNGVQQTFYFSVSVGSNFTNDFPPLAITYPASYGSQVLPEPTMIWTGPTNFADLSVNIQDTNGDEVNFDDLPLDTTNWIPDNFLAFGSYTFNLEYTNTPPNPDIIFSTPTNGSGQELAGWSSSSDFAVNLTTHFFVGTPPSWWLITHSTIRTTPPRTPAGTASICKGLIGLATTRPSPSPTAWWDQRWSFLGGGWFSLETNLISTLGDSFSVSLWLKTSTNYGNDSDPANNGLGIL